MADFALWGTACERQPGVFMRAYEENRKSAVETILEADLVATAIQGLMASRKEWKGNASQLLAALEEVVGEKAARSRNWPASAEALGRSLRRPATFLRKVGIEIGFKREGRGRKITIIQNPLPDWVGEQPSQPSQPSQHKQDQPVGDDSSGDSNRDGPGYLSQHPSRAKPLKSNGNDSSDSSDSKIPTQSGDPVCRRCGIPGNAVHGQLIQAGEGGAAGHYHPRCWTEERTKGPFRRREVPPDRRPGLGPEGDSLDDLK
jgi:hypothetical protein